MGRARRPGGMVNFGVLLLWCLALWFKDMGRQAPNQGSNCVPLLRAAVGVVGCLMLSFAGRVVGVLCCFSRGFGACGQGDLGRRLLVLGCVCRLVFAACLPFGCR